jgi:hypothetical protein
MSDLADALKTGTMADAKSIADANGQTEALRVELARREVKRLADEAASPVQPFTFYAGPAIHTMPRPRVIVDGRFIAGSLVFFLGESGVGKTFAGLSFHLALACGQQTWLGAAIHPDFRGQPIVYALAEGTGHFPLRLQGAVQRLGLDATPDEFVFLPSSIQIAHRGSVEAFIKQAEPYRPVAVGIDTYQRHGGPESEVEKVAMTLGHLDLIRTELKCLVTGYHHLPKDGRQTPRGSGAIDGSIDTAVYMTTDERGIMTFRFENRDLGASTCYGQLVTEQLDNSVDDFGRPRTTQVLTEVGPQRVQQIVKRDKHAETLTTAIMAAVTLMPGLNQTELCKAVGGNKAKAVAEILRLTGTGQLKKIQTPGKAGQTINTFELGLVPF